MTNFISALAIILLSFLCTKTLSGQAVKETVKVVVIEKSIDENGNTTETKVIKEGDEAKKYLKEKNMPMDKNSWTTDEGEEIEIDDMDLKIIKKKKVKMIQKDDDGKEEVIEWEGDGEMPDDIKEALEEHDVDIIEENDTDVKVIVGNEGESAQTRIKILKSHNGDEEDIEIEMDGDELSDEMKKMLEEQGIDLQIMESGNGNEKTITIVTDDEAELNNNKAQLGVYLYDDEDGVIIEEVIEGSSAHSGGLKEGDIITAIGDKKISSMDELVEEIGRYNVGDVIIIHYIRANKNESKEVTLQARKDTVKKKSKKVEKYIFIEKEK